LLAEVNPANARAVVAHDAAASAASLIAAAENVGLHVRLISDTRPPKLANNPAAQLHVLGNRQLLIVAAVCFFILSVVNSLGARRVYPTRDDGRLAAKPQTRRIDEVDPLVPDGAQKHGILIGATALLWAFFLAKSFIGRR
jgi:hypothetical protein